MLRFFSCTALIIACLFSATTPAPSQSTASAQGGGRPLAAPDYVFYQHIFRFALYLDEKQSDPNPAAKPANGLHKYFSERVGTTDDENAIILRRAKAWKAEVEPVEKESRSLIDAIHAQTPGGILAPGQAPPAVPPHLIELQQTKDAITMKHIAELRNELGGERSLVIEDQLHKATHINYSHPHAQQRNSTR